MTVREPWPISEVPMSSTTLPSESACTVEVDASGAPGSVTPKASPRPAPVEATGPSHPMHSVTRPSPSRRSASSGLPPGFSSSPR